MTIAIIDYGMGNLRSVEKALRRIGVHSIITNKKEKIDLADKIILPGVGHFGKGIENLKSLGLVSVLNNNVLLKEKPVLGICLGMQLMTNKSEEGNKEGLKWIDAETIAFDKSIIGQRKTPHMGWNNAEFINNPLIKNVSINGSYYFVHSYHVKCINKENIMSETEYGYIFTSGIRRGNIFGVQFHPEKSHKIGLNLLKLFAEY